MDELRVWNYALTENQVRQTMCKKLTGQEPGLIGYWTFDETTGNILNDKSLKHFNGLLKGNPKRVFSGAPVGDQSVFTYTNTWTGKSLSLIDNDYKIAVDNIRGNPEGIHLYSVNSIPSQTAGLNLSDINEPYFGVFVAMGLTIICSMLRSPTKALNHVKYLAERTIVSLPGRQLVFR